MQVQSDLTIDLSEWALIFQQNHRPLNQRVPGSSPGAPTKQKAFTFNKLRKRSPRTKGSRTTFFAAGLRMAKLLCDFFCIRIFIPFDRARRSDGTVHTLVKSDERQKSAGECLRRIRIHCRDMKNPHVFIAAFTASAVIGSERTRAPTALKTALPIAGAITVTAGSPTPVACSPLAITLTATSGN